MNTPSNRIHSTRSIPFFVFHAIAFIGVFLVPFGWKWVGLCVGMYALRMFAITGGYHRYNVQLFVAMGTTKLLRLRTLYHVERLCVW